MAPPPDRSGKLTIFLGYAAGTGKTYQMLVEAQRLRASGVDLVIGYFESHARNDTIARAEGLEVVPRRIIEYRGTAFEEMDTEAVMARNPAACVVDEFAHTNVPGSLRAKRWEDVQVLQHAGIDVLTTVNIQHLESLNDQIWNATGVRVRETIPDWVVQGADEVVTVDITPRALQHRLERGVVYEPEKARTALLNFFQESNLTVLRELALRQAARQVEDRRTDLLERGAEMRTAPRSKDRVLIVLTPDPSSAMLIRRGKRVADYLRADCLAISVQGNERQSGSSKERSDAHLLQFARNLHIEVTELAARDTGRAIAEFARARAVTHLFISRRSPDIERLVENASNMEVIIVAERNR